MENKFGKFPIFQNLEKANEWSQWVEKKLKNDGWIGLPGLQLLAIQGIMDFKGRHSKKVLVLNASTFK